jgi:4-hydroxy-2,2'-bipyrrole-5-methanol synthase
MKNSDINPMDLTVRDFYSEDGPDLFAKCRSFNAFLKELDRDGTYRTIYRLPLAGRLDHRIRIRDPVSGAVVEMICFDSNSYLGLHIHPRVTEAVKRALDDVGYGTPSAQVLSGTNHYLRRLEQVVSEFHKREDAIIFPSGYSANIGVFTALLRKNDMAAIDRFSHASIHDGVRSSGVGMRFVYPHNDLDALDKQLTEVAASGFGGGKLIASDGVFSMHGSLASLDKLRNLATRHNAVLLIDDAHSTGVIGPNGYGIEEHFQMPGAIDVLVGTFSKAAGAVGGYVCGSRELVNYLRYYAHAGLFTASLPAATCAGLTEAYRVMQDEPEHRIKLWHNVRKIDKELREAGLLLPVKAESPIITVFMGSSRLLRLFSRELYKSRIKCGNVDYPAVPRGESVIRLAVNCRHTDQDISQTVDVFSRLGKKFGILFRDCHEIHEIGHQFA